MRIDIILNLFNVGLTHYLILGAVLFCIGIVGLIISRNIIRVLMSIEIFFPLKFERCIFFIEL